MRIAQFVAGQSWGSVTPDALERGLGGRETAAVMLGLCWAELGHEVTVFAATTESWHQINEPDDGGGRVSFVPLDLCHRMLTTYPYDALLSWEEPGIFAAPGLDQNMIRVCGMQVAHVHDPPEILALADRWVALSPWHARFLSRQVPEECVIEVQPNCVDPQRYSIGTQRPHIDPKAPRFFYGSSPDRGLLHVLRAWTEIRRRFSGATLGIVYGAREWSEMLRFTHGVEGEMATDILQLIGQEGIVDHGRVGQDVVARLHRESDMLLYPCDTITPTETGCITVLEAMAAGNIPLLVDCDCLGEEFAGNGAVVLPEPYNEQTYLDAVQGVVNDPYAQDNLREQGYAFIRTRTWPGVAGRWIEMFERIAAEKRQQAVAA